MRSVYPAPGFLEGVRKLVTKNRSVLIIDEISAGFRICTGGAHLQFNVEPDIAVFSKAIGNGYPIAAIIGKKKVMDAAQNTFISSTMWTERIGPVAALATIEKFQEKNVAPHLMTIGRKIQEGWARAAQEAKVKITVSGIYPLSHFVFDDSVHPTMKAYYVQEMLKKGFLASNLFYSMYAHTNNCVDQYVKATKDVFKKMTLLIKQKKLNAALRGAPASSGFRRLT
ncbi:MAG: aminotransferase class III-fold pyridoxal phosphate-dependent enzyme [Candidatus Moranbacteria bacterium]|nr:aminotransferase class III-fold pyridoxal phosphate-dependent enzyme [Candidatus Moranbacteria bacterium]